MRFLIIFSIYLTACAVNAARSVRTNDAETVAPNGHQNTENIVASSSLSELSEKSDENDEKSCLEYIFKTFKRFLLNIAPNGYNRYQLGPSAKFKNGKLYINGKYIPGFTESQGAVLEYGEGKITVNGIRIKELDGIAGNGTTIVGNNNTNHTGNTGNIGDGNNILNGNYNTGTMVNTGNIDNNQPRWALPNPYFQPPHNGLYFNPYYNGFNNYNNANQGASVVVQNGALMINGIQIPEFDENQGAIIKYGKGSLTINGKIKTEFNGIVGEGLIKIGPGPDFVTNSIGNTGTINIQPRRKKIGG